jgi:hypothetical protein
VNKPLASMLLAGVLCLAAAPGWAHRFHAGIADVVHNDKTGSVEIVHTYMAHDIDALLATAARRPVDLTKPEDEALLRSYVEQRFFLLGHDQARLPLKWIGVTVSVESVVIYQELERAPLDSVARIHNGVLTDFMPRQANTVNITREGVTSSLAFDSSTEERRAK